MINPQVVKIPPKFSYRNLKKYLLQKKEMARKEGIARIEKKKEGGDGDDKKPLKVCTVLAVFKGSLQKKTGNSLVFDQRGGTPPPSRFGQFPVFSLNVSANFPFFP